MNSGIIELVDNNYIKSRDELQSIYSPLGIVVHAYRFEEQNRPAKQVVLWHHIKYHYQSHSILWIQRNGRNGLGIWKISLGIREEFGKPS